MNRVLCAIALVLFIASPEPPRPERRPHVREIHGYKLTDDYFWLRERDNPKVIEHLKAENAYTADAHRLRGF